MISSGGADGRDKSCLLVAANPATRDMVANLVTQLGWKLEEAPDNEAALEQASRRNFDLILTGEKTSGKQDIELLRRIRRARPHTRLIILTEEGTPEEVIDSMRARAFSYFSKPFSLESLAQMVRTAMAEPCWDDGIEVLSATPSWIRLAARCEKKTAERLMQFFEEFVDLPSGERQDVAYAFREMLLNAMQHGAKFDPSQLVEIAYLRARHMVICRVKDPGEGFAMEELYHAAVANPPEDPIRHSLYRQAKNLPPGGYGILLAKHMVDELIYGEQGNDVLLVKYVNHETSEHPDETVAASH